MATQPAFFHALLRPSILQILRATGYHSARPSVVDSLTDIAARYLYTLCQSAASHSIHNHGDAGDYTVVDVRMALRDAGALQPEKTATEQAWLGEEDVRGVEEFIEWFSGQRMRELMEMGVGDGEIDATDYLNALKKKHSKTVEEGKYTGTVIGKPLDAVAEIQVEGGPVKTISEWIQQRSSLPGGESKQTNGTGRHDRGGSPTPSSGLSSVGSRLGEDDVEMHLSS